MTDHEIEEHEEYPMEFDKGEFSLRFKCLCGNEYLFSIFLYDDGLMTLKIDTLGIKEKN